MLNEFCLVNCDTLLLFRAVFLFKSRYRIQQLDRYLTIILYNKNMKFYVRYFLLLCVLNKWKRISVSVNKFLLRISIKL